MFSCEFRKIFKNTCFTEHLWVAASAHCSWRLAPQASITICSWNQFNCSQRQRTQNLIFLLRWVFLWEIHESFLTFNEIFFIGYLKFTCTKMCTIFGLILWCQIVEAIFRSSYQWCSVKKMFLEISQNSQENVCAWFSFLIKLQAFGLNCSKNCPPGHST